MTLTSKTHRLVLSVWNGAFHAAKQHEEQERDLKTEEREDESHAQRSGGGIGSSIGRFLQGGVNRQNDSTGVPRTAYLRSRVLPFGRQVSRWVS